MVKWQEEKADAAAGAALAAAVAGLLFPSSLDEWENKAHNSIPTSREAGSG